MDLNPLGNPLNLLRTKKSFCKIGKIASKYNVFGPRAPSRNHPDPLRIFQRPPKEPTKPSRISWRPPRLASQEQLQDPHGENQMISGTKRKRKLKDLCAHRLAHLVSHRIAQGPPEDLPRTPKILPRMHWRHPRSSREQIQDPQGPPRTP